jgi:hypothetical protein
MAVPKYDDLMNPTIQALKQLGGKANIKDLDEKVAENINLSDIDLKEIHRGKRTKLSYRLAWSRNYLKRFGLLENVERGIWSLTEAGKEVSFVDKEEVRKSLKEARGGIYEIEEDETLEDNETIEVEINDEDDVEDEKKDDYEDIISPFAPKDIKIVVEPKTIDHLVTRLRYDEIDMNTEFQRKGNLWKPEVQSRLIESILLRLPLPPFYFDASDDNKWLVVDGLQRLWSIKNFIINAEKKSSPLELNGLEILTDFSGKNITYDKLNRTMQRRILETPITTYLIQPGTPKEVKYNVFRRINTGGLGLNSMEIRNALNQGKPSDFLRDLSEDTDIKAILRLQDKRMEDRELFLRAYAFINKDYTKYQKPLSTFLDKAMESLGQKTPNELDKLSRGIIDAVFFQGELFGKHIFSRSISGIPYRVKLNSALFEVWVSLVYKLNEAQRIALLKNREQLISEYKNLLKEDDFVRAVATSTSGKGAVKTRFEGIINLIHKFTK